MRGSLAEKITCRLIQMCVRSHGGDDFQVPRENAVFRSRRAR